METPGNDHPTRARVLDALSLIASSERMASVRPDLEPGRYAYLLCLMWFDEVYPPGTRYVEGLKGDRDPEAVAAFQACFDEDENRWLERFNRFFELRLDRMKALSKKEGVFPPGDRWDHVAKDAANLIALLGGNERKTAAALEEVLRRQLPGA